MRGRGPDAGYAFAAKEEDYRKPLWLAVDGMFDYKHRSIRTVLYLDTAEALETLFLLRRGYQPQNLHVVNRSVAEVAWIQRRVREAGFASVNTYGCEFEEMIARINKIDVISFDGTGNLNLNNCQMLGKLCTTLNASVLSCNLFVGRERQLNWDRVRSTMNQFEDSGNFSHDSFNKLTHVKVAARAGGAMVEIGRQSNNCIVHFKNAVWSSYVSSQNRMVWFVSRVISCEKDKPGSILKSVSPLIPMPRCFQTNKQRFSKLLKDMSMGRNTLNDKKLSTVRNR